jgi:RNA polymerase sigma-70 factor (ECF subfamily)
MSVERSQIASNTVDIDAWYRQYGQRVYRRCLRMTRDETTAWDLTQETFLKAHDRRKQFRGDSSPLGWLYRIANRCFLDTLRKKEPIAVQELEDFIHDESESHAGRFERHDLVVRLLSRVPKDVHEIVLHRYFDELEHAQIAELLGINEKTVRRKLERFLTSARKFAGSQA